MRANKIERPAWTIEDVEDHGLRPQKIKSLL